MIEGSGSIPLTSGSGSWRPKNMWIRTQIRIRNTVWNWTSFVLCLQDEQLALLVDPVLDTEDRNMDGFIDYPEYIAATLKQRIKDKQRAVHHTASWWRHSVIWRHSVMMTSFALMTSFNPGDVIWRADDVIQFWWRYLMCWWRHSVLMKLFDVDDVIQSW